MENIMISKSKEDRVKRLGHLVNCLSFTSFIVIVFMMIFGVRIEYCLAISFLMIIATFVAFIRYLTEFIA